MAIHPSAILVTAEKSADYQHVVNELDEANRSGRTIGPFAHARGLSQHDAYAIQKAWNSARTARGERRIGYKVGFTSANVRRMLKAEGPAYGMLFETMLHSEGSEVAIGTFHSPRVEVELAFVIGARLSGPDCSVADVLNATDYIVPALEIIDNRVESLANDPLRPTVNDIIADNVASAGAVLGRFHKRALVTRLERIPALLSRNGVIEDSGVSAIVGGHPAAGVASLVNHLAASGDSLLQGEIVLSGTFTTPLPVQSGDLIEADYGPWGTVSVRFR